MRVTDVVVTPVAVKDPPLLNAIGMHQPYALRSIIQVHTDDGLTGLGETFGDAPVVAALRRAGDELGGLDPFDLNGLHQRVSASLQPRIASDGEAASGQWGLNTGAPVVVSAFEVALLDIQGKAVGRPVCDLLGGRVRDAVPFSAYLFYKWATHPGTPGDSADDWGAVQDADEIVTEAKRMVDTYGFRSIKLKGGVMPPLEEVDAVLALRDAFPAYPIRIDPNTAWSVATSIDVGIRLAGILEYLEDPTPGLGGMAEVARAVEAPLATNMWVMSFADIPAAVDRRAVDVVLADHHFWGGPRACQRLAGICETFKIGMSMHSNTHLGISLAAMTHIAAAIPQLTHACDTHTPWQTEDVIEPGELTLIDGAVPVPDRPGLGVALDLDAVARLHEQWQHCAIRVRDDVTLMKAVNPAWTGHLPRF